MTAHPIRPLSARALKSCRDTLRPYLATSAVLDLYAGQGRFGFACLEEEARSVVFVERDAKNARALREGLPSSAQVVCQDVLDYLSGANPEEQFFDVVFADPPFAFWKESFEKKLFSAVSVVLREGAIFLVKHPKRVIVSWSNQAYPVGFPAFTVWKAAVFGESTLSYFRYGEASERKIHS